MPMEEGPHLDALREAVVLDGAAQRLLLDGDPGAPDALRQAAARYRSYGRGTDHNDAA